jgi:hypothetical protein
MDESPSLTTRNIGPLSFRAAISPGSINEERRTVEVVWTTGARVLRSFFGERWHEELSLDPKHVRMGRLESGRAPLLDSHNAYDSRSVIGVVEAARLEKGRGVATVRFAEGDQRSDAVWNKVRQGILANVSVGYRTHRAEKVEAGDAEIPVYRATDWEPYELSAVPMGADEGAAFRGADQQLSPCVFVERNEMSKKNDPQGGAAAPANEPAPDTRAAPDPTPAPSAEEVRAQAIRDERERVAGIQVAVRAARLGDEFADELVRSGVSLAEANAKVIAEMAKRNQGSTPPARGTADVTVTDDGRERWRRGAVAWILTRAGVAGLVSDASKKTGVPVETDPGEFRGMKFHDLAREALERGGVRTRGKSQMDLMGTALTFRDLGAPQGTSDFTVALENALHKTLLAAYAITPDTWSRFCAVGSVADFRAHPRYRMGSFGVLQTVAEGAEFKNQTIPDAKKESITAATKGSMITISRQALINDDMGVFSSLATMLGRAARLSIESDVYATLALNSGLGPTMNDGLTLFHATHANIGTGAALTVAAIDADRVVMAQQKDPSGNEFLDLRPAVLVIAIGLGGQARVINSAQYDIDNVGSVQNKFMQPNKVVGLFRDVVDSPRLSGTRRYLFADPALAPTLEVAFLEGNQTPYLESYEGWRVDGVEFKVRLDYGVGAVDFRGAVTNAGA